MVVCLRITPNGRAPFPAGPLSRTVDRMNAAADEKRANRKASTEGRIGLSREVGRLALDALGPHVAAIQRLADAAADRDTTDRALGVERDRASELVLRAKTEAAELVRAAESRRSEARLCYRYVFAAAISTGWTADQLEGLGYDRVLLRPRRLRPAGGGAATPEDAS